MVSHWFASSRNLIISGLPNCLAFRLRQRKSCKSHAAPNEMECEQQEAQHVHSVSSFISFCCYHEKTNENFSIHTGIISWKLEVNRSPKEGKSKTRGQSFTSDKIPELQTEWQSIASCLTQRWGSWSRADPKHSRVTAVSSTDLNTCNQGACTAIAFLPWLCQFGHGPLCICTPSVCLVRCFGSSEDTDTYSTTAHGPSHFSMRKSTWMFVLSAQRKDG